VGWKKACTHLGCTSPVSPDELDMSEDSPDKPTRRRRRRSRSSGSGNSGPGPAGTDKGAPKDSSGEESASDRSPGPKSEKPKEPEETKKTEETEEQIGIPVEDCAFAEFNLKEDLVRGLARAGYHTPSPIQARSLPHALEERDVIGQARTGTGKTAAFMVPALQMLSDKPGPRVLIVVPTRELAMQVAGEGQRLGHFMNVRCLAIYGGDPMKGQLDELKKDPKILAATPGRLMDHMGRGTIKLVDLDMLILDEADRMFDLGFREDIDKIMRQAPSRRQTMLFSATLSDEVLGLAARYMNNPEQVFLAPDKMTVDEVDQSLFAVDRTLKTKLLIEVLKRESPERSIIFTRTKAGADRLAERLQKRRLGAQEIHSGLPQKKRERILADFRGGKFPFLIATDVAARGIDISDVSHVINFDIPENAEDYVHRIGRTARMGKRGRAVTFVTPDDGQFLTGIEKLINQIIPSASYDGFQSTIAPPAEEKDNTPKPPAYKRTLHGYIRPRKR
jgi:ATP-dependent RNA helicase DeaD